MCRSYTKTNILVNKIASSDESTLEENYRSEDQKHQLTQQGQPLRATNLRVSRTQTGRYVPVETS